MKVISESLEDTEAVAKEFIRSLQAGSEAVVVALTGDLGAGKTAFSQCIGAELGVKDPIQSPTFLIEKIYELHKEPWLHLVHIDAYRLEREDELVSLGWKEIISKPENLILVEWASKVEGLLPGNAIRVHFTHVDETTREIEISDNLHA